MKIRFTSATTPETGEVLNEAISSLEQKISEVWIEKDYGCKITKFVGYFVSVGDERENIEYCRKDNKVGWHKSPVTKEKVKYLSFALTFNVDTIIGKNLNEAILLLIDALKDKLQDPQIKMPKDFNYQLFAGELSRLLGNLIKYYQ